MTLEALARGDAKELEPTDWVAITQIRIDRFAEVSGDAQWIHIDSERAVRESPYRATVAHGFMILSMFSQLSREVLEVDDARLRLNYGVNRVRFPAPVPVGSFVRARFSVEGVKPFDGGVDVTLSATMELRDSPKPCCVAEWIVRYYAAR